MYVEIYYIYTYIYNTDSILIYQITFKIQINLKYKEKKIIELIT